MSWTQKPSNLFLGTGTGQNIPLSSVAKGREMIGKLASTKSNQACMITLGGRILDKFADDPTWAVASLEMCSKAIATKWNQRSLSQPVKNGISTKGPSPYMRKKKSLKYIKV